MNINQMKQAIHIRCTQYCYISSHKKSLKQLHIIVCLSVSVLHLQFINIFLLTSVYLEETISGTCTNNGSKIKLSTHKGRITFAWIWRLTGITFARRKGITIARKMYPRLFFCICADYLLFRLYLIYS
jgi:hypothetical protein